MYDDKDLFLLTLLGFALGLVLAVIGFEAVIEKNNQKLKDSCFTKQEIILDDIKFRCTYVTD